ncbi:MAG: SDR family oxidoreductase [Sedimenticola thiotaurini]|uniref:SDR family oxidoreductase n=1 Tax=Sedimenticola thiotaurini TaxID=1543721 RepID=A0A558DAR4_9GAMM|nr:MAG: SDR family oxidoreductase [Sedimenticola thiotaurini]
MSKRTILITGASGKFGKMMLEHFLSSGDTVIATSRSDSSLDEMNCVYERFGDRFIGIRCDLMQETSASELVTELEMRAVFPDSLVNNARNLEFLRMDRDGTVSRVNFANELLLDVIAPYELTMTLVKWPATKLKRVVNIGSQYGSVAANRTLYTEPLTQSPLHYSVAKAALAHLTKELAVRLAPNGVQVNCIAFGGVEGRVDEDFKRRYAQLCPQGRMLTDFEVAGPVDMLLSDHFSGMTGHVLAVDGGWTAW